MAVKLELRLDRRFQKKLKGEIGGHEFEVGILKNASHRRPVNGSRVTGLSGVLRSMGRPSNVTIADISNFMRRKVNFYREPFRNRNSRDLIRFANSFVKFALANGGISANRRRLENLLQAIVRNPILRGDYGSNTPGQVRRKGFNRFLIDTGQLFKAIKARVRRKYV